MATIELTETEVVNLACGIGLLIEYVTGRAKFIIDDPDTIQLVSDITMICNEYQLTADEMNNLVQKIRVPIIPYSKKESNNVRVLPS